MASCLACENEENDDPCANDQQTGNRGRPPELSGKWFDGNESIASTEISDGLTSEITAECGDFAEDSGQGVDDSEELDDSDTSSKESCSDCFDFDCVEAASAILQYLVCNDDGSEHSVCNEFDSSNPPAWDIGAYLRFMHTYFQCSDACILLAFVYIERLICSNPYVRITNRNIHTLLLTSLVVAVKFHDDVYYRNTFYSDVVGMSVESLNTCELELMKLINWRLCVDSDEFEQYRSDLRKALFGEEDEK